MEPGPILVTGATGYVGGRLVSRLLSTGYRVRALGRSLNKLKGREWGNNPNVEPVKADLYSSDLSSLKEALKGCTIAFYLIHSMNPEHKDFAKADRRAAKNFIDAADRTGIKRIIYLGGLIQESDDISPHLKSRIEVGNVLCSGSAKVTILRSPIILGSGSASFEMLRYLAERLPVMVMPSRVLDTEIQPICIRNVLTYLEKCLEKEETFGETYDIGGPEVITYRRLFEIYAEEAGLRRRLFLTPRLLPVSTLGRDFTFSIAKLFLPLPPAIVVPLLMGAANRTIVKDHRIKDIIPQQLMTCRDAIRRAIQKDSLQIVETRWTDAGELKPPEWLHMGDAPYAGGPLLQGGFRVTLNAQPNEIWPVISRIGGHNGWYYGDFLWQVRGWMDSMAGGVGLRRGRRHPEKLLVGDALDFWRVLKVDPPYRLILVAEMKLPGEAILDFELLPEGDRTEIRLGTRFRTMGLYGQLYWYILLPFHDLLFGGMLREISRRSKRPIIKGPGKFKPGPLNY